MSFDLSERDGAVTKLGDLVSAERFVIGAFRHWVTGIGEPVLAIHHTIVWNDFAREFGAADGKAALTAFVAMIHGIARAARRPIRYHRPCCPYLTADEKWFIRVAGAGQEADRTLAAALCCWLVAPPGQPDVIRDAMTFGGLLRHHRHHLPSRRAHPVPSRASPDETRRPPKADANAAERCG